MHAWHVTWTLPRPRGDRAAIRRVARRLGALPGIAAFHLSDTHLHVLAIGERPECGRLAMRVALALAAEFPGLGPARFSPVRDAPHLATTFDYVLRNDERHGVTPDPWRENSNLPDLLGLRLTGAATIAVVRTALPRLTAADLRTLAGWPATATAPLPAAIVRGELPDVVVAVPALDRLPARGALGADLRAAALAAARAAGIELAEAAALLALPESTARRLAARSVSPRVTLAVTRQLQVRAACPLPAANLPFDPAEPEPARPFRRRPAR